MWPSSWTTQPRWRAKSTTAPSESRNSSDLVLLRGSDVYARSLLEAISERICEVRIFEGRLVGCLTDSSYEHVDDRERTERPRTSEKTPYSSLGTSRLFMAFQTRS